MPAPIGNKNGAKPADQVASSILKLRCRRQDKAAWVKAASRSGRRKLAPWVIDQLNRAAQS